MFSCNLKNLSYDFVLNKFINFEKTKLYQTVEKVIQLFNLNYNTVNFL